MGGDGAGGRMGSPKSEVANPLSVSLGELKSYCTSSYNGCDAYAQLGSPAYPLVSSLPDPQEQRDSHLFGET